MEKRKKKKKTDCSGCETSCKKRHHQSWRCRNRYEAMFI